MTYMKPPFLGIFLEIDEKEIRKEQFRKGNLVVAMRTFNFTLAELGTDLQHR